MFYCFVPLFRYRFVDVFEHSTRYPICALMFLAGNTIISYFCLFCLFLGMRLHITIYLAVSLVFPAKNVVLFFTPFSMLEYLPSLVLYILLSPHRSRSSLFISFYLHVLFLCFLDTVCVFCNANVSLRPV